MTREQARFILSAYRSGGQDATDPAFEEALLLAVSDPELKAWFERDLAHSTRVTSKIASIHPPTELRDAILAGARVADSSAGRRRWILPVGFAAAAALALVYSSLPSRSPSEPEDVGRLSSLTVFAVEDARQGGHGRTGVVPVQLRSMLESNHLHLRDNNPVNFTELLASDCRTLELSGGDVIEVCFTRNGFRYHLYAMRRENVAHPLAAGASQCGEAGNLSYVSWADKVHQFIVVSSADVDTIRELL